MSPAARLPAHTLAQAARPDVTVAIDRLVLEDPAIGPGQAQRIQEMVERRVRALLEEGAWPDPATGAPLPRDGGLASDDEAVADALARAVVDAVRSQGGEHGHA